MSKFIQGFVSIYAVLWFLTAVYGWLWGSKSDHSFAYNLGRAFFWPDIWFNTDIVGQFVLGIIILFIVFKSIAR
ncbi:hypothetical protein [Lonepinella sp. MS14435]|uniref:hypothetical protein n=1 Tax=Lonepinella sp. MS14435 TaxID=3003618 RepID=UPI0036D9954C